jgi:hypothetical protein
MTTYKIIRFTFNDEHPDNHKVIQTGLTLGQAQQHCNDEMTSGKDAERGQWFDGYEEE